MEFLRKRVRQPYSVMWISPRCYVNNGRIGNPLIPDFLLTKLKNSM